MLLRAFASLISLAIAAEAAASPPPPMPSKTREAVNARSCADPIDMRPGFQGIPSSSRPAAASELPKLTLHDPRIRLVGALKIWTKDPRGRGVAALTSVGRHGDLLAATADGHWLRIAVRWTEELQPVGAELAVAPIRTHEGAALNAIEPSALVRLNVPDLHLMSVEGEDIVRIFDFNGCGPAARGVPGYRLEPSPSGPVRLTVTDYVQLLIAEDRAADVITGTTSGAPQQKDGELEPLDVEMSTAHIAPLEGYRLSALSNPETFSPLGLISLWRGEGAAAGRTRLQEFDLPQFAHVQPAVGRAPRDLVTVDGRPIHGVWSQNLGEASDGRLIVLVSDERQTTGAPILLIAFRLQQTAEQPPP